MMCIQRRGQFFTTRRMAYGIVSHANDEGSYTRCYCCRMTPSRPTDHLPHTKKGFFQRPHVFRPSSTLRTNFTSTAGIVTNTCTCPLSAPSPFSFSAFDYCHYATAPTPHRSFTTTRTFLPRPPAHPHPPLFRAGAVAILTPLHHKIVYPAATGSGTVPGGGARDAAQPGGAAVGAQRD